MPQKWGSEIALWLATWHLCPSVLVAGPALPISSQIEHNLRFHPQSNYEILITVPTAIAQIRTWQPQAPFISGNLVLV